MDFLDQWPPSGLGDGTHGLFSSLGRTECGALCLGGRSGTEQLSRAARERTREAGAELHER